MAARTVSGKTWQVTRRDSGEVDLSLFLEEHGWRGETKVTWYPEDGPEAQMLWDLVTRLRHDAATRAPTSDPRGLVAIGIDDQDVDGH